MSCSEVKEYDGFESRCANCGREFEDGEVITVTETGEIFCESNPSSIGCVRKYIIKNLLKRRIDDLLRTTRMRFRKKQE